MDSLTRRDRMLHDQPVDEDCGLSTGQTSSVPTSYNDWSAHFLRNDHFSGTQPNMAMDPAELILKRTML